MAKEHEIVGDLVAPSPFAYCECILSLFAPDQAPGWWLALQDSDKPLFAPHIRIREVPLDQAGQATAEAVADGFRPHLFVPKPCDWPAVYDALGRYQGFARPWVCGRDDETMTRLLHRPSAEVLAAQRSDDTSLSVPSPAYGKILDKVLAAHLDDFRQDPDMPSQLLGPGFSRHTRVSRLNPFRILAVEIDRIGGEVTLNQYYLNTDPQIPKESCNHPIGFAERKQLQFKEGSCLIDRSDSDRFDAIFTWLEMPTLLTLTQPELPPLKITQALVEYHDKILAGIQGARLNEFRAWMEAWTTRYFSDAPLRPVADQPIQWIARALEEIFREFELDILPLLPPDTALLRGRPQALRTRGRIMAPNEDDLRESLMQVAEVFASADDE